MGTDIKDKFTAGKAVLVGVDADGMADGECEISLEELRRLLSTAGGETVATLIQSRQVPDVRTYIGSGKIKELAELCRNNDAELAVFDCELTPSQIRNIEDELENVRVVDRSMLILDIFALHAATAEGKLQVELAQLKYTAPRLIGKGNDLSRLGGGIGTRGPGESKLESDRRHVKRRAEALESELKELSRKRLTMRAARDRSGIPKIAIVGYTNAGKSTLLNALTDAGILAEDKLFATLDPTTRKFVLPGGDAVLLTDTVGFIRRLPHHLIKAFRSTLDEAVCADILMIIVDASDPEYPSQLKVTEELLADLGAGDKPSIIVYNKCDKEAGSAGVPAPVTENCRTRCSVCISALTGQGLDELTARMEEFVRAGKRTMKFVIPNAEAGQLNTLYRLSAVEDVEYGEEFITVRASADDKVRGMMSKYVAEDGFELIDGNADGTDDDGEKFPDPPPDDIPEDYE
ncbi:MAG: GTPase HflX [Clostridia bacterium]|nr:GTPase HflX [Clostridia bacterium]